MVEGETGLPDWDPPVSLASLVLGGGLAIGVLTCTFFTFSTVNTGRSQGAVNRGRDGFWKTLTHSTERSFW